MNIKELSARPLKTTRDTIQQTQRNQLRNDLTDLLIPVLQEWFEREGKKTIVVRSPKGIMLELPHDELGGIPIEILLQMKTLNTDVFEYEQEYKDLQAKRLAKKQEKENKVKEAQARRNEK